MPSEVVYTAPREVAVQEYAASEPGPREVRLTTLYSGISHGTEMALYRGTGLWMDRHVTDDGFVEEGGSMQYPFRFGYEGVGVVDAVGSAVSEVRVGDRYYFWDHHRDSVIFSLDEANQSTLTSFTPVPQEAPQPVRYVFTALGGVALEAVLVAPVRLGESVAIFGLGAVGQLLVQLSKNAGADPVIAVDPLEERRDLALRMGADVVIDAKSQDVGAAIRKQFGTHGVDVAFEASGSVKAVAQAIRSATPFPKVVLVGMYHGSAEDLEFNAEFCRSGGTLIHSRSGGLRLRPEPTTEIQGWHRKWNLARIHTTVVRLIETERLRVDELISHRFPIQEAPTAYQLIDKHPELVLKVVLQCTGDLGSEMN